MSQREMLSGVYFASNPGNEETTYGFLQSGEMGVGFRESAAELLGRDNPTCIESALDMRYVCRCQTAARSIYLSIGSHMVSSPPIKSVNRDAYSRYCRVEFNKKIGLLLCPLSFSSTD